MLRTIAVFAVLSVVVFAVLFQSGAIRVAPPETPDDSDPRSGLPRANSLQPTPGTEHLTLGIRGDVLGAKSTIQVLSTDGAPVPEATVSFANSWQLIGRTDKNGLLYCDSGSGLRRRVLVTAHGFAPEYSLLGKAVSTTTTILLRPAWSLSGHVVDSAGRPVGSGVRVLAVGHNDQLLEADILASLTGAGPLSVAVTNDMSEFSLSGLRDGDSYHIYAGGEGYCSANSFAPPIMKAGSSRQQIVTVSPVYGARIVIRDAAGGPLLLGESLSGSWHGTPVPAVDDARIVVSGNWTAALLGLPASATSRSVFEKVFFFETKFDHGLQIPIVYEATFPGYEPARVTIEAKRALADVTQHSIRLERVTDTFGVVNIWLDPVEHVSSVIPDELGDRCPQLYLTELQDGKLLRAQLQGIARGFEDVTGVPAGDYFAVFRAPHQLFRFPRVPEQGPTVLSISKMPSELRVPIHGLGALRIAVLEPSGSEYAGPLSGTHVRTKGQEADDFYFSAPPYTIPLLPEGEYSLDVDLPNMDSPIQVSFSINEFEITNVVFPLSD